MGLQVPETLGLALLAPAFLLWHPVVKAFPAPVRKVTQFFSAALMLKSKNTFPKENASIQS